VKSKKPILLVEDDRVDVMTIRRALKEINVSNNVIVAGNGEEGLAYLQNPKNILPCIILLDINMPKMNGIEFLEIMKKEDRLKIIPVIVLTTSQEEQDRTNSFNLGISGYMIKPVDYKQFVDVIKTINLYWTLSELPEL
jgi:CheY-like chemotaxis protein